MIRTLIDNLAEWQIAYLAGLIDGEGSLECQKQMSANRVTPNFAVRVSLTFATTEPLSTISRWFDLPVHVYAAKQENRSARHQMNISKTMAVALLRRMLPYLILKRRQAELLIAIEETRAAHTPGRKTPFGTSRRMPQEAVIVMDALFSQIRGLKSHKRGIRQREMPVRLI